MIGVLHTIRLDLIRLWRIARYLIFAVGMPAGFIFCTPIGMVTPPQLPSRMGAPIS